MSDESEAIDAAFDDGLRALGEIVYYFQQLEDNLGRAVSFLIDPTDSATADVVVCEQSFRNLAGLGFSLFALYEESKDQKVLKEWESLLGRAIDAESTRNRILHSKFGVSMVDHPVFSREKTTAKFKKGFKSQVEALDEQTAKNYRQAIAAVDTDILGFMGRVFPDWNIRQWTRE